MQIIRGQYTNFRKKESKVRSDTLSLTPYLFSNSNWNFFERDADISAKKNQSK